MAIEQAEAGINWEYFHKNGARSIHENEQRLKWGKLVCPECVGERQEGDIGASEWLERLVGLGELERETWGIPTETIEGFLEELEREREGLGEGLELDNNLMMQYGIGLLLSYRREQGLG